jgi:hypothetical protein
VDSVPPSALTRPSVTPSQHPLDEVEVRGEIERTTWLDFATILIFFIGMFNVIDGISAVHGSAYVNKSVLFSNLQAWGWFFLAWGVIQIVAAVGIFKGARWAIAIGIFTAFLNALAQLSAARTEPVWAVTLMALDLVVIYSLVAHSGSTRDRV